MVGYNYYYYEYEMLQFLKSLLPLEYSEIEYKIILICCWCNCCVRTSTLQSFFKTSEFWNEISGFNVHVMDVNADEYKNRISDSRTYFTARKTET